jgi:hypothetical protein
MRTEYDYLKNESGMEQDPVLTLFEKFCGRAGDAFDSMEWSWKFQPGRTLGNRIFWLGAPRPAETRAHLEWLTGELGLDVRDGRLYDFTERALVSYAGANKDKGRSAAIRIYLTLDDCSEPVYSDYVRPAYPDLPASAPPGAVRALVCYAAYETGTVASRAYFLYHADQLREPAVREYLVNLLGERAVEVAAMHPSAGFAFKGDTTNMLGLSFRPTGIEAAGHPSWWNSPALTPLLYAAGRTPALRERLHRVSWVTVPLTSDALQFSYEMPEMNVYVRLAPQG